MLQALPLVESGAADAAGLTGEHLALACASHQGAEVHTGRVRAWLASLGLSESALRCGPQIPDDGPARHGLRAACACADQTHNNCSGKHSGFLTLNRHLKGGAEYTEPDHPVQRAVHAATEEICGESTHGFAIDGCSAPNFAVSLQGLATAMARMATPDRSLTGARAVAAARLTQAMAAHPVLVAGEGRACTALIRATTGGTVVKTGAEGVFVAILPEHGLGIALKIDDGSSRGSQAAIAALLARCGVLDRAHPLHGALADAPSLNRRGIDCGRLRAAGTLSA
jgi:L-asparaginase II